MNSYYAVPATSDEIYHHGIIGQKWGVRRYQNPDGSLTAAGQKRYAKTVDKYVSQSNKNNPKAGENFYKSMNKSTIKMPLSQTGQERMQGLFNSAKNGDLNEFYNQKIELKNDLEKDARHFLQETYDKKIKGLSDQNITYGEHYLSGRINAKRIVDLETWAIVNNYASDARKDYDKWSKADALWRTSNNKKTNEKAAKDLDKMDAEFEKKYGPGWHDYLCKVNKI